MPINRYDSIRGSSHVLSDRLFSRLYSSPSIFFSFDLQCAISYTRRSARPSNSTSFKLPVHHDRPGGHSGPAWYGILRREGGCTRGHQASLQTLLLTISLAARSCFFVSRQTIYILVWVSYYFQTFALSLNKVNLRVPKPSLRAALRPVLVVLDISTCRFESSCDFAHTLRVLTSPLSGEMPP